MTEVFVHPRSVCTSKTTWICPRAFYIRYGPHDSIIHHNWYIYTYKHYSSSPYSSLHTRHFTIVYSTVYSGADQRKHQSSASLAFVRGSHQGRVNSPHKGPLTRKIFPFDDVIMIFHTFFPVASAHTLLHALSLIHAGIKVHPYK